MADPDTPWDPWRELAGRQHLVLDFQPLPSGLGALYWLRGEDAVVVIDPALGRRERRAALAHELVHDERRILYQRGSPPAVMDKEEAITRAEVVGRLVPPAALDRLGRRGVTMETWEVAELFDVPDALAAAALHRFRGARRDGRRPRAG